MQRGIKNVFRSQFVAVAIVGLSIVGGAVATLNESHTTALEIAIPYVEEGFEVREDSWTGEIPAGESKLIRQQLFRGNEYWFWLATAIPDSEVIVEIFDREGEPVGLESSAKGNRSKVRVLPPKTGTYFIRITIDSKKEETLDWALVYGYR